MAPHVRPLGVALAKKKAMASPRWIPLALSLLLTAQAVQAAGLSCEAVWADSSNPLVIAKDKTLEIRRKILPYLQTEVRVSHLRLERNLSAKTLRILQNIYNKPLQILSPLPTQGVLSWEAPANKVLMKLWKDRAYEPTLAEWGDLVKYDALSTFLRRRDFLQSHPNLHRFRRTLLTINRSVLLGLFVIHGFFAEESRENAQNISDYLEDRDENDLRVEILNETTPYPRIAIRIGRKVYAAGARQLHVMTTDEYFSKAKNPEGKSPLGAWAEKHFVRSVQSIELILNPDEVKALRQELEAQRGKVSRRITLVSNRASPIVRALSKATSLNIPWNVDPSPAAVFAYMTALKIKNDPRIGALRQITEDGSEASIGLSARNMWINSMESKFWMATMTLNSSLHFLLNLGSTSDKAAELPDAATVKLAEELKDEADASVRQAPEFRELSASLSSLLDSPSVSNADLEAMAGRIRSVIDELKSPHRKSLEDPASSITAQVAAEASLMLLEETKLLFLSDLGAKAREIR